MTSQALFKGCVMSDVWKRIWSPFCYDVGLGEPSFREIFTQLGVSNEAIEELELDGGIIMFDNIVSILGEIKDGADVSDKFAVLCYIVLRKRSVKICDLDDIGDSHVVELAHVGDNRVVFIRLGDYFEVVTDSVTAEIVTDSMQAMIDELGGIDILSSFDA